LPEYSLIYNDSMLTLGSILLVKHGYLSWVKILKKIQNKMGYWRLGNKGSQSVFINFFGKFI